MKAFLWTVRVAAALGLVSLTLTEELGLAYVLLGWTAWTLSFALDRHALWGKQLRRLETAAVIVLIAVTLADVFYTKTSMYVCVAHFLVLFQVFKLLGEKARKDNLQILVFSFFQILSACTLSVDAWQAAVLSLLIPIGAAGLFWHQVTLEQEESSEPVPAEAKSPYKRWVTCICLAAIPVNLFFAVIIFTLFPRLAFRSFFAGLGGGKSGYTEQINLGQGGAIGNDTTTVLWMQIVPEEARSQWKGYLRGSTMDYFDGKQWRRSSLAVQQTLYPDNSGHFPVQQALSKSIRLRQSIMLVNTSGSTIFGSPMVTHLQAPLATLQIMVDGSVRWSAGWRKPLRYDVLSSDQPLPLVTHAQTPYYLQLPDMPLDKVRALSNQIASQRTPSEKAKAIEKHLREQFSYSVDVQGSDAANPLEYFLFESKRGPCGHFASAMALMLRLQNIPARVVAGYYKGTWNERLKQYVFRERDAHAWVEAYLPGSGWVTYDPTPRTSVVSSSQQWLFQVQQYWGYANYQWARLVVEYDLYAQWKTVDELQRRTSLTNAQFGRWRSRWMNDAKAEGRTSQKTIRPVLVLILVLGSAVILWMIVARRSRYNPDIAFYQRFLERMARRGFPKAAAETGEEYLARLREHPEYLTVKHMTERYYRTRFPLQPIS